MKRKAPIKMYQMGTPNLVPQGTQKAITDTASNVGNFFQGQKDMYTKGMGAVGDFAQSKMQQPGGALNLISPLAGKMSKLFNKGASSVKGNVKPKKYIAGVAEAASSILSNPQTQQLIGQMAPQLLGNLGSAGSKGAPGTGTKFENIVDSAIGIGGSIYGGPAFGAVYNTAKLGGKAAEGAGKAIGSWIDRRQAKNDEKSGKYADMYGRPYKNGTKIIKYQDGNENLQATKGIKDFIKYLEENERNISNASIPKEVAEKFDISSVADVMPDIPRRFPKGSKAPNDMEVGPTRKEMADLLRAYNKKERAVGRLGYIDMEEADRMYEQNEAMMGNKINRVPGKIETLSGKTPLIKLASTPELPEKLTGVPVEKQSRRDRKMEKLKQERLFNRQEAEYLSPKIARISSEIPTMQPNLKKVEVEAPTKKIKYFDYTTKEAKGGYARALKNIGKDGKVITTKEGWLTDPETGLVYKDLRNQKTKISTSKNKNTSSERTSNVPPAGQELIRMSRMGESPLYNKSVGVPEPIRRNYSKVEKRIEKKGVEKPKLTEAQIDSAINSINLPRFKGKNTLHPLEYRSK